MVSNWWMRGALGKLTGAQDRETASDCWTTVNPLFTANPLFRILGKLHAVRIRKIYPSLLSKPAIANPIATRGTNGVSNVFLAAYGILARAGARAAADRKDHRGGQGFADRYVRGCHRCVGGRVG